MTRETRLMEIETNTNVLMFDSMAKAIEIMSASLQANNKFLQDALEAGLANIEAGRKFLEIIQKTFLQTADAMTQPGVSYTQGLVKMAESSLAAMKTGRA